MMRVAALLALILVCAQPLAQPILARVINIVDGDTLTVQTPDTSRVKVRLAGIDAPERGQSFAEASRQHLREIVLNKTVAIEPGKYDRYGRVVALVRLQDGRDVGLAQVETGMAWWFRGTQTSKTLKHAQRTKLLN